MRSTLTVLALSLTLAGSLVLASGPARAAAPSATSLQQAHLAADGFARLEAVAADTSVSGAALQALAASEDWRVRMNAGVVLALRADADTARAVLEEAPEPTRAGLPRFVGAHYRTPQAAPVLLHRYFGEADEGTRYAIAEMLPRTQGDWSAAVAASWQAEQSGFVRSVLVEAIRHGELDHALEVLPEAARDSDWEVRAAAMRGVGWLDEGARLSEVLVEGLSDEHSEVRRFAARSLGWKGVESAWEPLRAALSDDDPLVRLRALRALERIDAARAAKLAELATLQADPDAKVARAARQVAGG